MAMTGPEQQERKDTTSSKMTNTDETYQKDKFGWLKLICIPLVLFVLYLISLLHDVYPEGKSKQAGMPSTSLLSPQNSAENAYAEIRRFLKDEDVDKGSLVPYQLHMYRGEERDKIKQYGERWVRQSNEVAVKALTEGYCRTLEGVTVYRYSADLNNPEIILECDGRGYEGTYRDLMKGKFMDINAYQEKKGGYYARASQEYNATDACHTRVNARVKNPEVIKYYPYTGYSNSHSGRDGLEYFLTEDFDEKDSFGRSLRNTFYCTVTSSGEIAVRYAHR